MPSKSASQARVSLLPCTACGVARTAGRAVLKRALLTSLCQPCSVAAYNATRPPKKPKEHKAQVMASWTQRNKQHLSLYYADYRDKIKAEMVAAYGGCCKQCGEKDHIVLVLDHIDENEPKQHRWGRRIGGFKLYQVLRAAEWPQKNFQILCHNCNFRKEYHRRKNAVRLRQAS